MRKGWWLDRTGRQTLRRTSVGNASEVNASARVVQGTTRMQVWYVQAMRILSIGGSEQLELRVSVVARTDMFTDTVTR